MKTRRQHQIEKRRAQGLEQRPEEQSEEKVKNKKEVEVQCSQRLEEHSTEQSEKVDGGGLETELSSSTEEPQPFRFLDLPLEIKCEIYKLLLTPKRNVLWTHTRIYLEKRPLKRYTKILRVSKRVHDEAATILYGYSRFIFFPHYHRYEPLLNGYKFAPEMMIPALPQRYRDLIFDVTLKAFDREAPKHNAQIWADRKRHSTSFLTRVSNSRFSCGAKWNAVRFTPSTAFEAEPLFKCQNLRKLTIELLPGLYTLAWGGGSRAHRMEEVEVIRELLKIRGLQELKLIDMGKIPKNFLHLVATKEKLERLLRAELLKPRRGRRQTQQLR